VIGFLGDIVPTTVGGVEIITGTIAGCVAVSVLYALVHPDEKRRREARQVLRDLLTFLRPGSKDKK
jgi:hypothetical protein